MSVQILQQFIDNETNAVLQKIFSLTPKKKKIVYIPLNHIKSPKLWETKI